MKYDASMTQFHGDIVAAIKSMIHGEEDKVAELAASVVEVVLPLSSYATVMVLIPIALIEVSCPLEL